MQCEHCKQRILQGRYYRSYTLHLPEASETNALADCCLCSNDNFDLCHACYKKGARCQIPTKHPLMLQLMGTGMILDSFSCPCPNRKNMTATQMQGGYCSICKETFGKAYLWRESPCISPVYTEVAKYVIKIAVHATMEISISADRVIRKGKDVMTLHTRCSSARHLRDLRSGCWDHRLWSWRFLRA